MNKSLNRRVELRRVGREIQEMKTMPFFPQKVLHHSSVMNPGIVQDERDDPVGMPLFEQTQEIQEHHGVGGFCLVKHSVPIMDVHGAKYQNWHDDRTSALVFDGQPRTKWIARHGKSGYAFRPCTEERHLLFPS